MIEPQGGQISVLRRSMGPLIKNDSAHRAAEIAAILARITTLPPSEIADAVRHLQRLARQAANSHAPRAEELRRLAHAIAQRLGLAVNIEGGRLRLVLGARAMMIY